VVLFAHDSLQGVAGELQLASVKIVFLSLFMFVCWVGGGGVRLLGDHTGSLCACGPHRAEKSQVSVFLLP